jgi:hypothetical protein
MMKAKQKYSATRVQTTCGLLLMTLPGLSGSPGCSRDAWKEYIRGVDVLGLRIFPESTRMRRCVHASSEMTDFENACSMFEQQVTTDAQAQAASYSNLVNFMAHAPKIPLQIGGPAPDLIPY